MKEGYIVISFKRKSGRLRKEKDGTKKKEMGRDRKETGGIEQAHKQ